MAGPAIPINYVPAGTKFYSQCVFGKDCFPQNSFSPLKKAIFAFNLTFWQTCLKYKTPVFIRKKDEFLGKLEVWSWFKKSWFNYFKANHIFLIHFYRINHQANIINLKSIEITPYLRFVIYYKVIFNRNQMK